MSVGLVVGLGVLGFCRLLCIQLFADGGFEDIVEGLPAGSVGDSLHSEGGEHLGRNLADKDGVREVHLAVALSRHLESHSAGDDLEVGELLGFHILVWFGFFWLGVIADTDH